MKDSRKIAITGGIGVGKSYVCSLLNVRGIHVYDCDAAAKRLIVQSESLQEKINDYWKELGDKMKFDWKTIEPIDNRNFYAKEK